MLDPKKKDKAKCPRLGKHMDNAGGKPLFDIKGGEYTFNLICFALSQCDRDLFTKFRDGEITLAQTVSRVEEIRTGLKYNVLDDLIPILHPSLLKVPDKSIMRAFEEQERERRLVKSAARRGIDPKELERTARNFNIPTRCNRSIYSQPIKRNRLLEDDNHLKHYGLHLLAVKAKKKILDDERLAKKVEEIDEKWQKFDDRMKKLDEEYNKKEHSRQPSN